MNTREVLLGYFRWYVGVLMPKGPRSMFQAEVVDCGFDPRRNHMHKIPAGATVCSVIAVNSHHAHDLMAAELNPSDPRTVGGKALKPVFCSGDLPRGDFSPCQPVSVRLPTASGGIKIPENAVGHVISTKDNGETFQVQLLQGPEVTIPFPLLRAVPSVQTT